MIIETLPVINPYNLQSDALAFEHLTKPFLSKLAKAIVSSIRIDVGTNQITFYGDKSLGDDLLLGVKGINGINTYSSGGQVTNIRRNNVFIGYTSITKQIDVTETLPLDEVKTHLEDYINTVEPDLQTYRVFRFYSEVLEETAESRPDLYTGRWVFIVIGLVSQNQTDYYTPFDSITEGDTNKYTVLDPSYVGNLNNFFIPGTDVPGNLSPDFYNGTGLINTPVVVDTPINMGSVKRDMSHRFASLPPTQQQAVINSAIDLQNKLNNL